MYQPLHSHGVLLADTSTRACIFQYRLLGIFFEKTKSNLENTLGQVRGTSRVKIKYITFQNWIMQFTIPYCTPDQIYCDLLWNSCFAFYDMVFSADYSCCRLYGLNIGEFFFKVIFCKEGFDLRRLNSYWLRR